MYDLISLGIFLMIMVLMFQGPITMWIILREIRKMAETLPESRREEWIEKALQSAAKGLETKNK